MAIADIRAFEVLDSRGNPTVLAEVTLADGSMGSACAPSGASTGSREALELRDGDKIALPRQRRADCRQQYQHHDHAICCVGKDANDQRALDNAMIAADGTENKAKLGANAILAVSLAAAKAAAISKKIPLYQHIAEINGTPGQYSMPVPMMNIINGGEHADNNVDIQEFMIQPVAAPTFAEALRAGAEIFHTLKKVLQAQGLNTAVGDEGGFAPNLPSNEAAIVGHHRSDRQSRLQSRQRYHLRPRLRVERILQRRQVRLWPVKARYSRSAQFADYLAGLAAKYPILSIEDGMDESDWDGWADLTEKSRSAKFSWSATICSSPTRKF